MQAVRGTRKTWEAGRRAGAQSRSDKADKNDKQTEDAGRITRHEKWVTNNHPNKNTKQAGVKCRPKEAAMNARSKAAGRGGEETGEEGRGNAQAIG